MEKIKNQFFKISIQNFKFQKYFLKLILKTDF